MKRKTKFLKEVALIQAGYHARTKVEEEINGTHRLIQGTDFDSNQILHLDKLTRFNPKRNPNLYKVYKKDVLFQARGIENFAYYVSEVPENALAASSFYIIRVMDNALLPGYLAWWFRQPPTLLYFKIQVGVAVTSFVKKETLANLSVKIPPIHVQEKIQRTVELWQKEQILQKRLTERKNTLINELCFKSIDGQGE
jgi:restriction endonuclease S subunit